MKLPIWSNDNANDSQLTMVEKNGVVEPASKPETQTQDVALTLHPIPSKDALIVQVQPPRAPATAVEHVPCDIVLVIDVSGSMGSPAPIPGEGSGESTGLSVLDLVKHAALTIVETLNGQDRLGIVTFATKSRIVQPLKPMTAANKALARNNISGMQVQDATNLWHGILDGIKLFKEAAGTGAKVPVPAMLVLTDGMPNHMCPHIGYIPKLRTMMPLPASIHTFGFGYNLRSGLLKSIAEVGSGNYAFIPDAGMIGTVFVHAIANLQTTYATEASLELSYTEPLDIQEVMGKSVDQNKPEQVMGAETGSMRLVIPLGNLQYGQSRDLFLRVKNIPELQELKKLGYMDNADVVVRAMLTLKKTDSRPIVNRRMSFFGSSASATNIPARIVTSLSTKRSIFDVSSLSDAEIAYHQSRALVCEYLSGIFPLGAYSEHHARDDLSDARQTKLEYLVKEIPAKKYKDTLNQSLMEDLVGMEPKGQISLAVNRPEYFSKWGKHYLPSLLNAHTRQICNSFKDTGPLQYGADSPLFLQCRDNLDAAFDNLPPPTPTNRHFAHGRGYSVPTSMSAYNNAWGVCFAGSTPVELASGRTVAIRRLRRGVRVRTPAGPRKVAMVLKTPVQAETMCRVGGVMVTPWHPISLDGKTWVFPAYVAEGPVRYTGAVYSILLQRDENSSAHAFRVGGIWGVGLGHGVTGTDVRAHEFFGDYDSVGKSLLQLGVARKGVVVGGGVERDETTGLVSGFKRLGEKARLDQGREYLHV